MFISCSYKNFGCFTFCKCCAKGIKWYALFVKIGTNYSQAIISMKLTKFTVLYTAAMKGDRHLLRKSYSFYLLMVVVVVVVVAAVVAFSSLVRILGECLTIHCLPALFFFFKVEISSCTLIPLFFMPGSVHSGSANWDDCGQMFSDKLRVSSFPDRVPHYAWTAA